MANVSIKAEGDAVRLQLDVPAGTLHSGLQVQDSTEVVLLLKDIDPAALRASLANLKAHPFIKRIDTLVPSQGLTPLRIEFARPVKVQDEKLVSLQDRRTRWEMIFAPDTQRVLPPKPALEQLVVVNREGRADLRLIGSATLEADLAFDSDGRQVVFELPGIRRQDLERVIAAADLARNPLLQKLSALDGGKGSSRLLVTLAADADVVAGEGVVSRGKGEILVSFVPDAAPQAQAPAISAMQLAESAGALSVFADNLGAARISAFTLDKPPRLVVDVLGSSVEDIKPLLPRVGGSSDLVHGVRLEETRLGSARVIFDLQRSQALLASGLQNQGNRWIVSLNGKGHLPAEQGAAALAAFAGEPISLELRQRQDADELHRPRMLIKPVVLSGKALNPRAANPALVQSGLPALFERALQNDPKYLAAKSDFMIAAESVPQARAALLPSAVIDVSRSMVQQNITEAPNKAFPTGSTNYPSFSWSLSISQPVLKLPAIYKLDQAELAIEQAKLNVVAAEQDLLLRTSAAYLGLLAALDGMELSSAEREATQKQFELAKSRLDNGLGTIAQVHDTESRFSLARAREIEARNRLQDARSALKEIVGSDVAAVLSFKTHFDPALPQPANPEAWVDAAINQNIALQSRKLAEQIAGLEIKRQKGGYYPTMALVGTTNGQNTKGSFYGGGQRQQNNELALKLNMPVYEGGMTNSLVREAGVRLEKAMLEREQEERKTERATRAAYQSVETSASMLEALRKAVIAQDSALQTRQEGYKAGVSSVVAVADAYRLYYSARRDYLQARYDYLVNRLKLKQAVGALGREDLTDLASLMQ
ncbi:MAG: TolC family outer membrane protein [Vogesella sp.]|uniref:TolC family outer membrane protein n=1 Tax=Vogesella sp. TaxID=1904252 RepID=UPI003919DEE7